MSPLRLVQLALPAACAFLFACAPHQPIYLDPDFAARSVETIALTPIADTRAEPFAEVQVASYVRRGIESALTRKGYRVVPAAPPAAGARSEARTRAVTDTELGTLAPEGVRYVMAVEVDQVVRSTEELGEVTRVRLSGRLFDVREKRVVWSDMAQGDMRFGGLLSVLRGPSSTFSGAFEASKALVSTLPDRKAGGAGAGEASVPPADEDSQRELPPADAQ